MQLDLTLAICAYNAQQRLPTALEALARQSAQGIGREVLVIDNNSTDATAATAQQMGQSLGLPLRVIHEPQPGLAAARRRAAVEARGRYLSYVDDDNLVELDWTEQCVTFLDEHPRCGVVGGRIDPLFEDPAARPADFQEHFAMALAIRDFGPQARQLIPPADDPPCGAGMSGRTAVFRQVLCEIGLALSGRKGKRLSSGEDTEIGLLIHRLGWEMWYTPTLRMSHVLPSSRLTQQYLQRLIAGGAQSAAWLDYLRGKQPRCSRVAALGRYLRCRVQSMQMALLQRLRPRHPHAARYPAWAAQYNGQAAGYLDMALHDPAGRLERSLYRLRGASAATIAAAVAGTESL
jgi:GT2 family glycosyltransferase